MTSHRATHQRLRALGLCFTLAALSVLTLPALASAKAKPSYTLTSLGSKVKGYTFTLSCLSGGSPVISYAKGGSANEISYSDDGPGTCSQAASLKSATVDISWPGVATVALSGHKVLRTFKGEHVRGCSGRTGLTRELQLTGSVDVTAAKYFGTFSGKRLKVDVGDSGSLNCGRSVKKATEFSASFGQSQFIDVDLPKKGEPSADLEDTYATAAPGVTGSLDMLLTNKKLFSLKKGKGTLENLKPYASGGLVATELPKCIGSDAAATNVTLTGAITVKSPVLGAVVFNSAGASNASIGALGASPGLCNGYGSTALSPALGNSCSMSGLCSLSELPGSNVVTFYDESDAGTQNIVSESINFGNSGNPSTSATGTFTNGQASYTYPASPGTYTATLTVETGNGQTQSASSTVYITS